MKKVLSGLLIILFSVSILFIVKDNSLAGDNDKNVFPNPKVFELKPDSDFTAKANCLVSGDTAYGKTSIGTLMLTGTISEGLTKDNLTAYYTEGDISVSFTY